MSDGVDDVRSDYGGWGHGHRDRAQPRANRGRRAASLPTNPGEVPTHLWHLIKNSDS